MVKEKDKQTTSAKKENTVKKSKSNAIQNAKKSLKNKSSKITNKKNKITNTTKTNSNSKTKESKSTKNTTKKTKTNKKSKLIKLTKTTKTDSELNKIKLSQPEVNIGLVGHVDSGKTTLTHALSGKWTDTHSEELKRGITIRLGYADTIFSKCKNCNKFTSKDKCPYCGGEIKPIRKVSFVDSPGHESLMATMLSGAAIMDGALLLISANEHCPQTQTREHLVALEIIGIKNLVVVQNKIDLVTKEKALENYMEIKEFLKGTSFENAPIVPVSAQHPETISNLIKIINETIKTPKRELNKEPLMFVARSFDINKPGSNPLNIVGGVIGGSLIQGKFKIGDEIEIKPGRKIEKEGKIFWEPLKTKIISLHSGKEKLQEAHAGGTLAVMTSLDPAVVKSDSLAGSLVGHVGKLPPTWNYIKLKVHLLDQVVGSKEVQKVEPLRQGEVLMINVHSAATVCIIKNLSKGVVEGVLKLPVCAEIGAKTTVSRLIGTRWRLIGWSEIVK